MLILLFRPASISFRRDLKAVASLTKTNFDVKRKFSENLNWVDITKGSSLFQGDEVFTGDNSEASIVFEKSKATIKLPPKSLVKIEEINNDVIIEIKEGVAEIHLERKGKINVKSGNKSFEINAKTSSTVMLSNQAGKLSVSTTDGLVDISNEGKKVELTKNDSVRMDEKLTIVAIQIYTPKANQQIDIFNNEAFLKLNHPVIGKVIVSKDSSFETIALTKDLANVQELGLTELKEGNYFLKITTNEDSSDIRSFSIVNSLSFKPNSPLDGESINLKSINESVRLIWENNNSQASYEIEVINDEKVRKFTQKNKSFIDITGLIGNTFWWKGRTLYKDKKTEFSPPAFVQLDFNRPIVLLNTPKTTIDTLEKSTNIKWKKLAPKENFIISTKDEDGSLKNLVTNDDQWNLNQLPKGKYNIQISSKTYPGKNNSVSKNFLITEQIIFWDKEQEELYTSIEPPYEIQLKYLTNRKKNIRFLLQNENKKPFIPANVSDNTLTLDNFGQYCIKAEGDPSLLLSDSQPYCFEYKHTPAFGPIPKAEDQIIAYTQYNEQDAYLIKVPEILKAVRYKFAIFLDKEATNQIFEGESTTSELPWISDREGNFYLRYKVFDHRGRVSLFSPLSRILFPISPNEEW